MSNQLHDSILRSLRRITRSIDLHSRQLASAYGLTGPQLVCLRTVGREGEMSPGRLAKEVSLSQATVTGILDRLVARQLITRVDSQADRRQVTVTLTAAGRDLIAHAPHPLQESFVARLRALPQTQQENIRATLETVVHMMDGEELSAAPVLSTSADAPEEVHEV